MASPGNQHCTNCIGTLSFPIAVASKVWHRSRLSTIWRILASMPPLTSLTQSICATTKTAQTSATSVTMCSASLHSTVTS